MAPREPAKPTTTVQRKEMPAKGRASPVGAIKKTILVKKTVDKTPLKINNTTQARALRQRTSTVPIPKVNTPTPKENRSVPVPSSATKSAMKPSWKRRPKPAHSGIPIPEKMRKMMEKESLDSKFAL